MELILFSHFAVGITWDDAPTEQNAVINTDYKIRCVVLASPPATIDWLKESLIVSTGRILHRLQNFFNYVIYTYMLAPFFPFVTFMDFSLLFFPPRIATSSLFSHSFFLSCLFCLFSWTTMQWSNSHPSLKSYPSVKEVGSSLCVKVYQNIG